VSHGVETVGKDNPLIEELAAASSESYGVTYCEGLYAYPVSHSHLEDRPILFRPALSYERVMLTKFKKTSEEWKSRYLRKTLDMRGISPVKETVEEERN
jgi:hypothetical protein